MSVLFVGYCYVVFFFFEQKTAFEMRISDWSSYVFSSDLLDVITTREPGGSPGAEAIRSLVLTGQSDRWSARAEALLFAAARADHVEKTIRPALAAGKWVLSDRFLDSSRAYQSAASGLSDADIWELHRFGSAGLLPDRTLVLMLPEEDA